MTPAALATAQERAENLLRSIQLQVAELALLVVTAPAMATPASKTHWAPAPRRTRCLRCGGLLPERHNAQRLYCGNSCKHKACYARKVAAA